MIHIDGSQGEGGGQLLRSSLALSMATGQPFWMVNVRANRPKPGLMRQHHTCVIAAAKVCGAQITGAEVGSREVTFTPGKLKPGTYHFAIGTAGSTTMVLQAVLPAILFAGEQFDLTVEGGTHNTSAPPFEFFNTVLLPRLIAMGADLDTSLRRHGFYPAGGGNIGVQIRPGSAPRPLVIDGIGRPTDRRIRVVNAHVPSDVSRREISALVAHLSWQDRPTEVIEVTESHSPGNALMAFLTGEGINEVFTAFGERGKRSETVAQEVADQVHAYLAHNAPVGEHLADQLLVPMALGAGGSFITGPLSSHTRTNIDTVNRFLPGAVTAEGLEGRRNRITVRARA